MFSGLLFMPKGMMVPAFALMFGGCGSLVRVEYQNPKYGGAAVEFALPRKEGYAK